MSLTSIKYLTYDNNYKHVGGPCHEDHNKGRTMRGTKESIRKKKKQNYGHGSKSGYVKGYEAGYDGRSDMMSTGACAGTKDEN